MKRTQQFLFMILVLPGCAYLKDRALDFGQIWTAQAEVGVGVDAGIRLGELAHLGLGAKFAVHGGAHYGVARGGQQIEAHFPLGFVFLPYDLAVLRADPDAHHGKFFWQSHFDQDSWNGNESRPEQCYMVLPFLTREKPIPPLHGADIEMDVFVFVGIRLGFSPGEFLDFIVGWFGVDLDPAPVGKPSDSPQSGESPEAPK